VTSHRPITPHIIHIPLTSLLVYKIPIIVASPCHHLHCKRLICTHLICPRGIIPVPTTNDACIEVYVLIGMETSSYCALAGASGAGAACVASILRGTIVVERRLVDEGRLSIGVGAVIADDGAIDVCVRAEEVCVGIIPKKGIGCHYGYGWFCGGVTCANRT